MAAWWTDEIENRVNLTITEENPHLMAILAEMDPEGDAIRVELGAFTSTDEEAADQTVSYQTMPGSGAGTAEHPIAIEPAAEDLPAYQEHRQSGRDGPAEEPVSDLDAPSCAGSVSQEGNTASYNPQA